MRLYFAYGSKMPRLAMKRRIRAVGPAVVNGYRFFVDLDGWGSAAPSAGDTVHGVLWRLYDVQYLPVRHGTRCARAMIYLMRRRAIGNPRPRYVEMVAAAARSWQLPESYIRSVERWSASCWTGARIFDAGELA